MENIKLDVICPNCGSRIEKSERCSVCNNEIHPYMFYARGTWDIVGIGYENYPNFNSRRGVAPSINTVYSYSVPRTSTSMRIPVAPPPLNWRNNHHTNDDKWAKRRATTLPCHFMRAKRLDLSKRGNVKA